MVKYFIFTRACVLILLEMHLWDIHPPPHLLMPALSIHFVQPLMPKTRWKGVTFMMSVFLLMIIVAVVVTGGVIFLIPLWILSIIHFGQIRNMPIRAQILGLQR